MNFKKKSFYKLEFFKSIYKISSYRFRKINREKNKISSIKKLIVISSFYTCNILGELIKFFDLKKEKDKHCFGKVALEKRIVLAIFFFVSISCTGIFQKEKENFISDGISKEYNLFLLELPQFSVLDRNQILSMNSILGKECDIEKRKFKTLYYLYHEYNFEENLKDSYLKCVWNSNKELIAFEREMKSSKKKIKIFLYEKNPTSISLVDLSMNIEINRNWLWVAKNGKWYSTLTFLEFKNFSKSKGYIYHFNRHNGILEKKEEYLIHKKGNQKEGWEYEKWKYGYEKCSLWKNDKLMKEDLQSCELSGKINITKEQLDFFGNEYVPH